ncbi:radical SAM protein [Nocardia asteroides]|uniref:radical SAM protein n=1 Tax=Nocardia asteroides TaxID=1824 RepID=UPI001E51011C|nr:radical SAM protein [Nocardia asteroides]UGT64425.1 radical SAM protein [Nocardia asteroides]
MLDTAAFQLPELHFDHVEQCYRTDDANSTEELIARMHVPLSATYQLTRFCNLKCVYCSEPPDGISTKLDVHLERVDRLTGMRRIIVAGGEPMVYKHFWPFMEYIRDKFEVVVLSTNAVMIGPDEAARLKDLVDYIDVTLDGPRRQHDAIRGNYPKVTRGLMSVALAQIPLSVICVYMPAERNLLTKPRPGNRDVIHYICQQADLLGAVKTKILTPIPKGRSEDIFEEFVAQQELDDLADFLAAEKERNGWRSRIIISDWMRIGKGHAWLIEPNGRVVASPVWGMEDCIHPFGSMADAAAARPSDSFSYGLDAAGLWAAYPYRKEHLAKYLERTLIVR